MTINFAGLVSFGRSTETQIIVPGSLLTERLFPSRQVFVLFLVFFFLPHPVSRTNRVNECLLGMNLGLQRTLRTLLENGFFFPPNSHLIEKPPGEASCSDTHCPSTQSASDCGTMRKIAKPAVLFSAQFSPQGHSDTPASAFYGTHNRILSKWILNDQKLLDQKNSIYNKICHFKVNFIFFLPRGCEWTISCGLQ